MSFVEKIDPQDLLNPRICLQDDNLVRNILLYNGVDSKIASARVVVADVYSRLPWKSIRKKKGETIIQTREDIVALADAITKEKIIEEEEFAAIVSEHFKALVKKSTHKIHIDVDTGTIILQDYNAADLACYGIGKSAHCDTSHIRLDKSGRIEKKTLETRYDIEDEKERGTGIRVKIVSREEIVSLFNEHSIEMERKTIYTDYTGQEPQTSGWKMTRLDKYPFAVKVEKSEGGKITVEGIAFGNECCEMPGLSLNKLCTLGLKGRTLYTEEEFEALVSQYKQEVERNELYRLLTKKSWHSENYPQSIETTQYWYSTQYIEDQQVQELMRLGHALGLISEQQMK